MEHFHHTIPGWFSYEYIYKNIVEQADDDSLFVEIGSYKGKSTAYMAVDIANSGKNIKFECIDPMELMGHYLSIPEDEKQGYSAEDFHSRLEPVKQYYKLHQMTSDAAVDQFEDGSIDFIMIDGDHSYEAVKQDIINYLPKMRSGGLMAGDDAWDANVARAVKEAASHLEPVIDGIHFFIRIP